jgi:hypothetical protein
MVRGWPEVPNRPKTPIRSVRCDPVLWEAARANLEASGTDASAAVRGYMAAIAEATEQELAEILAQFPPK